MRAAIHLAEATPETAALSRWCLRGRGPQRSGVDQLQLRLPSHDLHSFIPGTAGQFANSADACVPHTPVLLEWGESDGGEGRVKPNSGNLSEGVGGGRGASMVRLHCPH